MALAGGPADPGGNAIKKTLRHIIVFAVIVLALYLLLPKLVDTQETVKYISHASYVLLAAAVALEVAALVGYANLFRYVLRVLDIRMRLREVWAITLSSLAVSHILSAGGVGGWVVTYNALHEAQGAARHHLRGHRGAAVLQLRRAVVLLRGRRWCT